MHAYGAVVYVKVAGQATTHSNIHLLVSKTRVSPLKSKLTLPRLELMGALVAARLVHYVRTALYDCTVDSHFWTDSTIALGWIRQDPSRWSTFVANRVAEIRSLTDPGLWRHCTGDSNPADLLTRGVSAQRLVAEELWWHGPPWLKSDPSEWPMDASSGQDVEDEVRKAPPKGQTSVQLLTKSAEDIIDLPKYSSLDKLLFVTSYILRFVNNVKNPRQRIAGALSSSEIQVAKLKWIRRVQGEVYQIKIENGQTASPMLKDLQFFIDDEGILRAKGRLQHINDEERIKHPIIYPAIIISQRS
ncbi:uncharacterized protein LOC135392505 [Ornithodoros turicata]|uniref:uncharacterized protein LOC135392505 n=1 Tax=Ornithodoros turicata TaxID=34597 RepID=UPI003139E5F8